MANSFENSAYDYEAFFTLNLDLLCIASTEGYFLRINNSWEQILGYTIQDLLNVKIIDLIHPEDQEKTLQALSNLDSGIAIHTFINRYKHKNGQYKYLEWCSKPLHGIIYASAKDITDRKLKEEAFIRNEKRLKAMIESQSNYIIRLDRAFNYLQVNKKFYNDFAWLYPKDDLVGFNCFDCIHEEQLGSLEEWAALSLAEPGQTFQIEVLHKARNNEKFYILWEYTCLTSDEGNGIEFQVLGINITEKKELDNKQRLEKEKELLEMSSPITQLWDGILLLPIVGMVSAQRAHNIMHSLLKKIAETQSKVLILDISGVGVIDSEVANHFIKMSKATKLMGCICTICGISPAISQTIIELGINIEEIKTTGSMKDALEQGLLSTGLRLINV